MKKIYAVLITSILSSISQLSYTQKNEPITITQEYTLPNLATVNIIGKKESIDITTKNQHDKWYKKLKFSRKKSNRNLNNILSITAILAPNSKIKEPYKCTYNEINNEFTIKTKKFYDQKHNDQIYEYLIVLPELTPIDVKSDGAISYAGKHAEIEANGVVAYARKDEPASRYTITKNNSLKRKFSDKKFKNEEKPLVRLTSSLQIVNIFKTSN